MSNTSEIETLLRAAKRNVDALVGMSTDTKLYAEQIFGQHVQQAVEISLKTWIAASLDEKFPYTHDLSRLLRQLEDAGCEVASYRNLSDFADFGVRFRYEDLIADSEPIDRASVLAEVQHLYQHVDSIVQSLKIEATEKQNEES